MATSRRRKAGGSSPKGTARRTLSAARFFFDQAGRREPHDVEHYEYYVEASIVFARMALEHLRTQFSEKRGAEKWIKNLEETPLIKDLKRKRNYLSHDQPIGSTPPRGKRVCTLMNRHQRPRVRTICCPLSWMPLSLL